MLFSSLVSFHRKVASVPVAAAYLCLVRSMNPAPEAVLGRAIGTLLAICAMALILSAAVYGLLRLVGYRLKRSEQIIAFCVCSALVAYAIISQRMHH
jgi:hypothetical protein